MQFAGFLSDYDPSLIFALTYDTERKVSYLKVIKIHRRESEDSNRSVSFAENAEKEGYIHTVRSNLAENGMQRAVPFSNDNYQVTVDAGK